MSVWLLETNTDRLNGIRPRFRAKAVIYSNESRIILPTLGARGSSAFVGNNLFHPASVLPGKWFIIVVDLFYYCRMPRFQSFPAAEAPSCVIGNIANHPGLISNVLPIEALHGSRDKLNQIFYDLEKIS